MKAQRQHRTPRILGVDVLKPEDLQFLQEKSAVPPLQRIKDSHHALCRCIASGMSLSEAAHHTGFSVTRACIIANDPSGKELIAHYRSLVTEAWVAETSEYVRMMYADGVKAERLLSERLDAEPETFSNPQLIAISADRADRFGPSKKSMAVNVNVDFARQLEAARQRVIEAGVASEGEAT